MTQRIDDQDAIWTAFVETNVCRPSRSAVASCVATMLPFLRRASGAVRGATRDGRMADG